MHQRSEDDRRGHRSRVPVSLVSESTCGITWPVLRRQFDRIAVGTFTDLIGTFRLRTEICSGQAAILEQLGIDQLIPDTSR